ncbi:Nucleotide-binding universal stress protein, UspA family [Pedobacter sp. ok626]|uniref:universal stress protein n=1 Tax=Pedobacter sp. ok626 TaxID=1761882 RepID=UPI00088D9116|nr:universal stress protein [Pedobacter sp. ok626]SDJ79825.1 Nucleotide-binding universal stress protein, UspA family [Pedobacter sp. ok626]
MKTIIVATDFSPGASNATVYASKFASATGAKIILFHIFHMSIHALNARLQASEMDELMIISKKKLLEKANKFSVDYKIEVITAWCMGDFQEELQKIINSTQADIVVMGMAARSIEQDLLGNTTTAAVHSLKFPILAVPVNAVYKGLTTMLFACDITRGVHKKILEKVKNIAIGLGSTIEIFHVDTKISQLEHQQKDSGILETFEDGLNGTSHYYRNIESNTIIEAIQDEITNINADLLIMVPYKYGFWGSMIHRSKTTMMASKSEIPLLSIPL